MIIRQLVWRQGRRAVVGNPWRASTRLFSTTIDTIEASTENSLNQIHSLSAEVNAVSRTTQTPDDAASYQTAPSAPISRSLAQQYLEFREKEKVMGSIGSQVTPHYQPNVLLNHPPSAADVTLELLLASESHQGHATPLWNAANARWIHGIRQGIHIISLEATAAHLRRSARVVQEVARRGGIILFVGTRPGQDRIVVRAAELAKGYHLFERWIPGSITNGQQILGRLRMKVVNEKDEEVPGFEEVLLDRPVLKPDLVVCMNPLENYVLLHECALNNIPTIGVIDTNADPTWVTYPIPANDDSLRCIAVIAGVLGRAGEAGQKQRLEAAERGEITFIAEKLSLPEDTQAPSTETKTPRESMGSQDEVKVHVSKEGGKYEVNKSVDEMPESIADPDEVADILDAKRTHESDARIRKSA